MRSASRGIDVTAYPLEGARLPRIPGTMIARPESQDEIDDEEKNAQRQNEGADGGDEIEGIPSHHGRIGPDPARHAQEPGEVHRQEGDVEAGEHQPEDKAPESFGERV